MGETPIGTPLRVCSTCIYCRWSDRARKLYREWQDGDDPQELVKEGIEKLRHDFEVFLEQLGSEGWHGLSDEAEQKIADIFARYESVNINGVETPKSMPNGSMFDPTSAVVSRGNMPTPSQGRTHRRSSTTSARRRREAAPSGSSAAPPSPLTHPAQLGQGSEAASTKSRRADSRGSLSQARHDFKRRKIAGLVEQQRDPANVLEGHSAEGDVDKTFAFLQTMKVKEQLSLAKDCLERLYEARVLGSEY